MMMIMTTRHYDKLDARFKVATTIKTVILSAISTTTYDVIKTIKITLKYLLNNNKNMKSRHGLLF